MRILFLISFFFISFFSHCQQAYYSSKIRWISVQDSVGEIKCQILTKWQEKSTKNEGLFFWFDRGEIKKAESAYAGYLLSGQYISYDKYSNLYEKGRLRMGKKVGTWLKWNAYGVLIEKSMWKKGLQDGKTMQFENNTIIKKKYSSNKLNGWIKFYDSKSHKLIKKEKYRSNELKKTKVIGEKKKNNSWFDKIKVKESLHKLNIKPHSKMKKEFLDKPVKHVRKTR